MSSASSPAIGGYSPSISHHESYSQPPPLPNISESPFRLISDAGNSRPRSGTSEPLRHFREGNLSTDSYSKANVHSQLQQAHVSRASIATDREYMQMSEIDPNGLLQALELNPRWAPSGLTGNRPPTMLTMAAIGWSFPSAEKALLELGTSADGAYRHSVINSDPSMNKALCGLVLTSTSMYVVDFILPQAQAAFSVLLQEETTDSPEPHHREEKSDHLHTSNELKDAGRDISSPLDDPPADDPLADTTIPNAHGNKSAFGSLSNSVSQPSNVLSLLPQCHILSEISLESLRSVSVLANTVEDIAAVQPPASPNAQKTSVTLPDSPFVALEIFGTSSNPLLTFVPLSSQALDNTPEFEIIYEFCVIPNVKVDFKVLDKDLIASRARKQPDTGNDFVADTTQKFGSTNALSFAAAMSPDAIEVFSNGSSPALSPARARRSIASSNTGNVFGSGRGFLEHYHRSFVNNNSPSPSLKSPDFESTSPEVGQRKRFASSPGANSNFGQSPASPNNPLAPFFGGRSYSLVYSQAVGIDEEGLRGQRGVADGSRDTNLLTQLQLSEQSNRFQNYEAEASRRLLIINAFWSIYSKLAAQRFQKDIQAIRDTHTSLFARQLQNKNQRSQLSEDNSLAIASLATPVMDKATEQQLVATGILQKPLNNDVAALIDLHEKQVRQRMGKYFTSTRQQLLTRARDLEWSIFAAAHKDQLTNLSKEIYTSKRQHAKASDDVAHLKEQMKLLEESIETYKNREAAVLERSRKREEALFVELQQEKAEKAKLLQKVRQLQLIHGKNTLESDGNPKSNSTLEPNFEEVSGIPDEELPLRRKFSMFGK